MSQKPTFEALISCVKDYEERYLSKGSIKLQHSEIYDLDKGFRKNISYPYAADRGVYAILDGENVVLYIGKASHGTIGRRLGSYFTYAKDRAAELAFMPRWGVWTRPPRYVVAVKVEHAWEASSLEEYLIAKLAPEDNTLGKIANVVDQPEI